MAIPARICRGTSWRRRNYCLWITKRLPNYHHPILWRVCINTSTYVSLLKFPSQPFWASMVAAAGAGTHPIHHSSLTAEKLTDAIKFCLQPTALSSAQNIAAAMSAEHGVQKAVEFFHANLPIETLQCEIMDDRPATWLYSNRGTKIRLCTFVAQILIEGRRIKSKDLRL